MLHRINMHGGNVHEWREMLCECVTLGGKNQFLLTVRQWQQEGIDKVPLVAFVELLGPCILHLKNHVGEKIITMIIRFGLQKCQQAPLTYLAELQDVFRKEVLGSPECPSQWKLPFKTESDGTAKYNRSRDVKSPRNYFAICFSGEGT
jgi:hypothetical protein